MNFAGYQLLESFPQQGATKVYLARHVQFGEHRFAIKILTKEFAADQELAAAFLQQASSAQQMQHACVAKIHESGEFHGIPYYVMDCIRGETLESKRRTMCLLDKVYVVKQLAQILGYFAGLDRVHGNINPRNIWLHENGSRLVLTDYGFSHETALRITSPDSAHARYTTCFTSPEQAAFLATDPRSDIYSLGAVFYTLLAGRPLTETRNPVLPESKREFAPLLHKALAGNREDRFQTAREFIAALGQISDEQILCADGMAVNSTQDATRVAREDQVPAAKQGTTTLRKSATVSVLPLKPNRMAGAERRAGGELARVLRHSVAPVKPGSAQQSTRRKLRPPASRLQTPVTSNTASVASGPRNGVESIGARVEPQWPARGRGVVAGILLALAAGLAFYEVQNNGQLVEMFEGYRVPALPDEIGVWWDNAGQAVPDVARKLAEDVVMFARSGRWPPAGDNEQVRDAPVARDAIANDPGTGVNSGPAPMESRVQPGITSLPDPDQRKVIELLVQAKARFDAGHLVTPADYSAYSYYQQVLALDKSNAAALLGVADIAAQQHAMALEQRRKGNLEQAIQLAKSSARLVPDDAKSLLLRGLEEQWVEQQQRLQETMAALLGQAERKLEEGKALQPASDNAVVAYRRILALDPLNITALTALETIKHQALLQVQEKLDAGALNSADALMARIGVFFHSARPELEVLSARLNQLRSISSQPRKQVLTQAYLEGQGIAGPADRHSRQNREL